VIHVSFAVRHSFCPWCFVSWYFTSTSGGSLSTRGSSGTAIEMIRRRVFKESVRSLWGGYCWTICKLGPFLGFQIRRFGGNVNGHVESLDILVNASIPFNVSVPTSVSVSWYSYSHSEPSSSMVWSFEGVRVSSFILLRQSFRMMLE